MALKSKCALRILNVLLFFSIFVAAMAAAVVVVLDVRMPKWLNFGF